MLDLSRPQSNEITLIDRIPLDQNPAAVYLAGLSPSSRRTMKYALNTIAGLLTGDQDAFRVAWWSLRYQHVAAIRSKLAEAYSPSSANLMLSAMRGSLREAWRLGLIPEDDYRRTIDIKGIRGEKLPAGRSISIEELSALLRACEENGNPGGIRDRAIITTLYAAGLRRAEICGLDCHDYERAEKVIRVRMGKGKKEREVPLAEGAAWALDAWLIVRGEIPGPLFNPVNKSGRIQYRRLSAQAIYNLFKKRAKKARVEKISPHDCRRSLITHLLEAGADLITVSKIAGHANVTTTARYDKRGEEAKREAINLLHIPK